MKTKILALILACLMLVTVLAACSKKKNDNTSSTVSSDDNSEFAEIDSYVASLANDVNFDGDTFSIVGKDSDHCEFEEVTGNLENDALYNRMREIEEIFGVTYEYAMCDGENYDSSPSLEVIAKTEADVMSGSAVYDAIHSNIMVGGQVMLGAGLLQPVETLPGIDLYQSWWLNDIETQFGIGGHLFYLTGKIVTDHYTDPSCILFNKEVAENFNIDGLYDLANAGEWTFDKMVEVSSVIPGDGSMFRLAMGNYESGLAFYFAGGFSICETDDEGNLNIPTSLGNAKTDWIDKLASTFSDEKAYYVDKRNTDENGPSADFVDGQVLMTADTMGGVAGFRTEDVEFGILPMPKRDTDQKEYISFSQSMKVTSYTVSKVAKDTEKTGVILEAMAALSAKYLEPAYYDKALKGRGTYDNESRDMLDLIYAAKKIDYATTYQWGDLWEIIDDAITGLKDGYVADYTSASRLANLRVKQLVDSIKREHQ